MARSERVRQEALERDGHRCQICGGEPVEVHHVQALGMGGSVELDKTENCICLCAKCHRDAHGKLIHIETWNPAMGALVVTDGTYHRKRIPKAHLWFYRQELAEELAPIEARLQALHQLDGDVARDVHRLWKDDAWRVLDPEAKSFAEYAASRGWDTRRAYTLAKLMDRGEALGLTWGAGETAADFRRAVKNADPAPKREWWWLVVHDGELVRATDGGKVVEAFPARKVVKVGKFVAGFRVERGKLFDRDGNEIEIVSV